MIGKSKNFKIIFSDKSSTFLTVIDYEKEFEGILKVDSLKMSSQNTFILPTKQFKAKTEEEIIIQVKEYLQDSFEMTFNIEPV